MSLRCIPSPITISGTNITAIAIDGASTGQTGTITRESAQVHSFSLSDGVVGGFFVDASSTHAAFADDDFNFGVVQKGAASLPTFSYTADLVAVWSGISVETDFDIFAQGNSSANCALAATVDCIVTTVPRTSSVNFSPGFNATFGRWGGVYTAAGPITGNVSAFLSADKTFAAAWACEDPDQFWPGDCIFSAWRR